jgi:hypothetical protein
VPFSNYKMNLCELQYFVLRKSPLRLYQNGY